MGRMGLAGPLPRIAALSPGWEWKGSPTEAGESLCRVNRENPGKAEGAARAREEETPPPLSGRREVHAGMELVGVMRPPSAQRARADRR